MAEYKPLDRKPAPKSLAIAFGVIVTEVAEEVEVIESILCTIERQRLERTSAWFDLSCISSA